MLMMICISDFSKNWSQILVSLIVLQTVVTLQSDFLHSETPLDLNFTKGLDYHHTLEPLDALQEYQLSVEARTTAHFENQQEGLLKSCFEQQTLPAYQILVFAAQDREVKLLSMQSLLKTALGD